MVLKNEKHQKIESFENIKQIFIEYLNKTNHRKTPERFTILKEIYDFQGHFDIEMLYNRMKINRYRVSRATLYNTMELFMESGLVIKHQFDKNCAQYEKNFCSKLHDHAICVKCRRVIEFHEPVINKVEESLKTLMVLIL